jgi:hypothetical protein
MLWCRKQSLFLGLDFQMEIIGVVKAGMKAWEQVYFWVLEIWFQRQKGRNTRPGAQVPRIINEQQWHGLVVTVFLAHLVPSQSLLDMVQNGTSSALRIGLSSFKTKGAPGLAIQRWKGLSGLRNASRFQVKGEIGPLKCGLSYPVGPWTTEICHRFFVK